LFMSGSQYEFGDNTKFSCEKSGLRPELKSFEALITKTWRERDNQRVRMFGKWGFHEYMPWFVFLSGVNKSSKALRME